MRSLWRPAVLILLFATLAWAQQQRPFKPNPNLYDTKADAKQEIADVLKEAKADHKKVILVFGGNWCIDCQVLDYWFHDPHIQPTVDANYHVIHVDVGQFDKNLDLPEKYGTTIKKGVPSLSILSSEGKVLFGDTTGEFEKAAHMDPREILAFLQKWAK